MRSTKPTKLDYAIMGLLRMSALSGYQIRQIFETSEMGNYSSSPGSIYPALKRMNKLGFVELVPQKSNKKKYALTEVGRDCLLNWLKQEVNPEDVYRHMDELLLKFAFMDQQISKEEQQQFLQQIEQLLPPKISELKSLFEAPDNQIPLNGRLAILHGIEVYQAHYVWVKKAQEAIKDTSSTI